MSTHYVLTYVTDTVIVFGVNVRCLVDRLNGVTAVCCVPVVVGIGRPVFSVIGMFAVNSANVTFAVVVIVLVRKLSFHGNIVLALSELEPVISIVLFVFGLALRMVTELISAIVANTVVVIIAFGVKSLKLCGNLVLTVGKGEPVVSFVLVVYGFALRMLTNLISAHVTNAVVSFKVYVLGFILLIVSYRMSTFNGVPVSRSAFFVYPLGFVKLVITELIFTNVTNTVVVFITVLVSGLSVLGDNRVVTGKLVPVMSFVLVIYVFFIGVIAHNVSALFTDTVVYRAFVVALSLHICSGVSADRRMPVTGFVISPHVRVEGVVLTAHIISARVTLAVFLALAVSLVYVSSLVNAGNVVSAGCSVPVILTVGCPSVALCIGVYVVVIPSADVTNAVIVDIGMIAFVLNWNSVVTVYSVPMLCIVVAPLRLVSVYVIVVPSADVAYSVVCFIYVSAVTAFNVVFAGRSIPMMRSIVGVIGLIGVLVIVVPFAHVTNTVVVLVLVRLAILGFYVTVTGGKEIVVSLVVGILFGIFVRAEYVIASFDVAFAIIVCVLVGTFYGSAAFVAFKILVLVLV